MSRTRVIILGGGFAGVKCAYHLARELSSEQVEIILFNQQNHLVFSPLLAEVVGSSINALDVIVPLRQLLPRVFCRTEEVKGIDFATNSVEFTAENEQSARLPYDHLVIACGNVTNLNVVPGMADHGFPLKTVADASALRSHLMDQMEQAEVASDPQRRRWHLACLVVGGGFSGAEAAGEINDLFRDSARYFRNWTLEDVKVTLIHSRDQILPEISPGLRDFAQKKMEKAGVEMVLNARVSSATAEGVGLGEDGQFLKGGTIVCTIGSSPAPLLAALKVEKQKGRLVTEPDMRLKGMKNVWAAGDCAWNMNAHDQQPSPTTGQFAERQGRQCAQNIIRVLRNQPSRPFAFKQLGELCSIGGHSAVADLFGMHLSGFLAWFVWRGVYLFKLPTIGRRLQVGFDWAWLLLFPRDLAHVRTQQTDRVARAHYQAGDYIFRQGDAPTNFYVVEKGEVEVIREDSKAPPEVVAVLGESAFFGERALLGNRPRVMSVRARTNVEVLVIGKNVFTQMSEALAPLRDALAQALNRRAVDVWKEQPEVHQLLLGTSVRDLLEPVPQPLLKPATTLLEVGQAFVEQANELFYISQNGETLDGIVTITDLLRARSSGIARDATASDFMTRNPVTVDANDTCAVASNAFREYRLKTLPVVDRSQGNKLVGCLRVRRLMAFVLKEHHGRPNAPAPAPNK